MASTDAIPVPRKNVAYRVTFPILDADGDLVTGASALDSEVSKDAGTFADCANEATEIATASGMYYLDLTSTEMNADCVAIIVKTSTSGAKTVPIVLYPQEAGDIKVDVQTWLAGTIPAVNVTGVPIVDLKYILGTVLTETAGQIAAGFKKLFDVASPVFTLVSVNQTGDGYARLGAPAGASHAADVAAVKAVLPSALVSGRIDASVGAMAANVLTATAINADAITAAKIADGAIDAATFAAGAIDSAAIATDAIGSAELAATAVAEIAGAVWDIVLSGHLTAGTTGFALNAAGSAGDPWGTALPGAYGAGSAGKIIGDNINATISSRLASAGYTAPLDAGATRSAVGLASANLDTQLGAIAGYIDTEVAAIKVKTDNIPASPAAVSDIPTANANADALLDRAAGVETGWTIRQTMRIVLSVLAGKGSGLATTTAKYRDMADSKDRITATVDADGNRTAVTRDAT